MRKTLITLLIFILMISGCNKTDIENIASATEQVTEQVASEVTQEETEDNSQAPLTEGYDAYFSWLDYDVVVTPQNQDPYGTCAIFAAISIFESSIAINTGDLVDLSEQHFINNTDEWTAQTGVSPVKVLAFMTENGVVLDERLPYTGVKERIELDPEFDYKLSSWGSAMLNGYPLNERIEIIKRNLTEYGPIITNIALYDDMNYYRNGIYECDESSGVLGGHWLTIVGWQDDSTVTNGGYWICKNSWGTEWGEDGYCRMVYGDASGIDDYILYYVGQPLADPYAQTESKYLEEFETSLDYIKEEIVRTPQDQLEYKADVIFAAVSVFESAIAKATGTLPDLSEQHFIDNSEYWFEGNKISPAMVFDFFIENGVVLDKTLPYTGVKSDHPLENKYDYKMHSWGIEHLDAYSNEDRIKIVKSNLVNYGPVLANIGLRDDFKTYEGGIYQADEELEPTSAHWLTIVGYVDDANLEKGGYWICKNSWGTDWGEDGFCKIAYNDICGIDDYSLYYVEEISVVGAEIPECFSWLNQDLIMVPQNQDFLGSCAVFASLSMVETHIALTTGNLPDLSEMHFISTSPKWSFEMGASPEDVLNFVKNQGIITEDKMPYDPYNVPSEPITNEYGYDYKMDSEWGSLLLQGNDLDTRIDLIKQHVLRYGPIISNIGLFNDLGKYTDGIYVGDESSGVVAGHWLVILGWQDDAGAPNGGYWICKNSWGTEWGEDGFCKVSYGDECGLDDYILYYIDIPKETIDQAIANLKAPDSDYLDTYTLTELQNDFDMFTDTLLTHNTFTFSDIDGFENLAAELRNELKEGMSEIEFYRMLAQMISYINCSHSRVSLSSTSEYSFGRNNYFMPIDIEYRENEMYVINCDRELNIPLESKLLSINGVDINDIVTKIYSMLPSDGQNTTYKKKLINEQFYYWYNLLYDNSVQYTVEFLDSETEQINTVSFIGVNKRTADVYMRNFDYGRRLKYEIDDNYVYLRIPSFNTVGGYTLFDYENIFEDFFNEINNEGIPNLIIDVRDNNGGHPQATNILLSYLADAPFQYFDSNLPPAYPSLQQDTPIKENNYEGDVYVICDGGSLSTTGHFLALFKYHNIGYIIGEESGAGHTCTDSSFDTTLPNTNITFRISSVKWNVAGEYTGEYGGVFPDYVFSPSIEDIINRVDSTLDYAISLINGN